MAELKFIKSGAAEKTSGCCGTAQGAPPNDLSCKVGLKTTEKERPAWITGSLTADAGVIPVISADIKRSERWEHVKCRTTSFRNSYSVPPGLYAVGSPDKGSDVLVSANYKLSFDALRKTLKGMNAWVLVLDTKGINVWCAAGKRTFGTDELIRRISAVKLDRVVSHRRLIVPQLGAPGISAHNVKKASGFRVFYGPVRAEDLKDYIAAGYRASKEMRKVKFPMIDRLILTPMEINPAMKKYYPWFALVTLAVFGLRPGGIFFRDALAGGVPFLLMGLVCIFAGALLTPLLLPFIPFRSFAIKGWITGMLSVVLSTRLVPLFGHLDPSLLVFTYLFFPMASSYVALQFTGSTTFTGMSGVKKELRISLPVYIISIISSLVLLTIYKIGEWGLL